MNVTIEAHAHLVKRGSAPYNSDHAVAALTPGMTGRWLVTTQGSRHIWDLDAMTHTRLPGASSPSGSFRFDGRPVPISHVENWPAVGCRSLIWFDDPTDPDLWIHRRLSSMIASIQHIASAAIGPDHDGDGDGG